MSYKRAIEVVIPYDLKSTDLRIDPSAKGRTFEEGVEAVFGEDIKDIPAYPGIHDAVSREEQIALMLRATIVLVAVKAGTLGECLYTARIWETG